MVNLIDIEELLQQIWEEGRAREFMEIPGLGIRGADLERDYLAACEECGEETPNDYLEAFCGKRVCPVCLSLAKHECVRCGKETAHWRGQHTPEGFVCDKCIKPVSREA